MNNFCPVDFSYYHVNPLALKPNIFDNPPKDSELKPAPYYKPDLPEGVERIRAIFIARRAINSGVDLNGRSTTYQGVPTRWILSQIKSEISNEVIIEMGYKSVREYLKEVNNNVMNEKKLLKHASRYQKEILIKEYKGKFPVEIQEYLYKENVHVHYSKHRNFLYKRSSK